MKKAELCLLQNSIPHLRELYKIFENSGSLNINLEKLNNAKNNVSQSEINVKPR
jgi:hypothetical protein